MKRSDDRPEAPADAVQRPQRNPMLRPSFYFWLSCWFGVIVHIAIEDTEHWYVAVWLMYLVCYPAVLFLIFIWKLLRSMFFPTPVQIVKGFRRQWPAISEGPQIVRVHRGESEMYVTVAREQNTWCDWCYQPRPVLIETEDSRWFCEGCTGDVDGDELWRAAVVSLVGNDGL